MNPPNHNRNYSFRTLETDKPKITHQKSENKEIKVLVKPIQWTDKERIKEISERYNKFKKKFPNNFSFTHRHQPEAKDVYTNTSKLRS